MHTCLSRGLPSENVSESCWTGRQRESHGRSEERPSEVGRGAARMKGRERRRKQQGEKERGVCRRTGEKSEIRNPLFSQGKISLRDKFVEERGRQKTAQ